MEKNLRLIEGIYQNLRDTLAQPRFTSLINRIAQDSSPRDPHPKGADVVLYTPWKFEPELMIVATNPSWFHERLRGESESTAKVVSKKNLAAVRGKIPRINSYIEHDHVFAKKLREYFGASRQMNVLKNCVGLNQFWIQTGSKSEIALTNPEDKKVLDELKELCASGTREIVKLARPNALWLFGDKAQKCFDNWDFEASGIIRIYKTWHPCQANKTQQKEADRQNLEVLRGF